MYDGLVSYRSDMAVHAHRKMQPPFFLKHWAATLFITVLVCLVSYFFIDRPLAGLFRVRSPSFTSTVQGITNLINPKYHYFAWPILFFLLCYVWKKQTWANRSLVILVSIPMGNLFAGVAKSLLGRARPDLFFTDGIYGFTFFAFSNRFLSFPSIHSCTIGAICGAFACFYPRYSTLFILVALVLAFSRVALGAHFLSDILAGVVIGVLVAQWIFFIMKQRPFQFVLR